MDIKSMYMEELNEWAKKKGLPEFRAKQIYKWMHEKYVAAPDNMTNLPKDLRRIIDEEGYVRITERARQVSKTDKTVKYLYELSDGQMIETVFMQYDYGNSICISSQAGCRMGCSFCASTIGGLVRNLTASEMLEQVYATMRKEEKRISNIVIMGTGEPLDNYENVVRFIKIISDENGYNISQRNITLSSCGIVPMIKRLADEKLTSLRFIAPTIKRRRTKMRRNLRGPEHSTRYPATEHVEIFLAELFQILGTDRFLMKGITSHTVQQSSIGAKG